MLIIIFGFSFYKNLLIYLVLLIGAGIVEYITNRGQIKFNFGHVFFLSMLIVRLIGMPEGVFFVLFAGFLPQVIVGNLDAKNLISYPLQMAAVFLSVFFIDFSFAYVGIIFSIAVYSLIFLSAKAVGEPLPELITEVGLPLFMNFIYFLSLGLPIASVMARVIG